MRFLKIRLARTALTLLAVFFWSGVASAETVTLQFSTWLVMEGASRQAAQDIFAMFEKDNPGIKIKVIGISYNEVLQQTMVSAAAGNLPDVVALNPKWAITVAARNVLADLKPYYSEAELGDIPSGALASGYYDGKLIAVPWNLGTIVALAWKPVLEKAGLPLKIPDTWDEFKAAVTKISALGPDIYGFGARTFKNANSAYWFFMPMWGHGGEFSNADNKIVFNNPGTVAALDWYKSIAAKKEIPLGVDVRESRNLWTKNKVGFIFDGPWMRGITRAQTGLPAEKADDMYVVGPMPKGPDGKRRTIANSHVLCVSDKSKKKEAAIKFVKFLTQNPAAVNFFYDTYGSVPTYRKFYKDPKYGSDNFLKTFVDSAEFCDGAPSRNPNLTGALESVATAMSSAVNQGDTKKAAAKAEKEIKALYGQ